VFVVRMFMIGASIYAAVLVLFIVPLFSLEVRHGVSRGVT